MTPNLIPIEWPDTQVLPFQNQSLAGKGEGSSFFILLFLAILFVAFLVWYNWTTKTDYAGHLPLGKKDRISTSAS